MRILPHLGPGIAAALMACVVCSVRAQVAVPKVGSCPSGYSGSGNDCVPRSGAGYAMFKEGSCPSGYTGSGQYCVGRPGVGEAVPKNGSCPSGYTSSGNDCVRRN
jgi:hypothetical protein